MTQSSTAAMTQSRKLIIYLCVLAGMFMATLDMQIVATALPTIAAQLGGVELFGWVGAAYLLALAAVMPFYGKLGDLYGRKRVFMFAITLFTLGSLACGLAWSMPMLIGARVLQGLGGGGLMISAFGIMADLFEPRERAKYQGYSSAVFTLSSIIGPVAGGIIAQSIGWEYIFFINIPIGILVVAVLAFQMPNFNTGRQPSIDILGGVLLAASVTGTVFWAENVMSGGFGPLVIYGLPVLVVLGLIAFVTVERRAIEPVVPLSLLTNPTISLSLLISIVGGISTLGMLNYFALFLQTITGLPPAYTGLLFLPSAVGSLVGAIGSGNIVARTGRYKIFPIAAMVLGLITMVGFAQVTGATPLWWICVLMFFFSMSIGLQTQTIMVAVQNAAPRQDVGAATGTVTLSRMIGASLGLAVNGGLLTAALVRGQAGMPADVSSQLPSAISTMTPNAMEQLPPALHIAVVDVFSHAFASVFYFAGAMFVVGLICAILMKDVKLEGRGAPQASGSAGRNDPLPVPAGE